MPGISRQAEGLGKLCLYEFGRRRGAGGLCLYGFRKQATLETLLAQPREKNSFLLSHIHRLHGVHRHDFDAEPQLAQLSYERVVLTRLPAKPPAATPGLGEGIGPRA